MAAGSVAARSASLNPGTQRISECSTIGIIVCSKNTPSGSPLASRPIVIVGVGDTVCRLIPAQARAREFAIDTSGAVWRQ